MNSYSFGHVTFCTGMAVIITRSGQDSKFISEGFLHLSTCGNMDMGHGETTGRFFPFERPA
jgi:hypothetical protein